MHSYNEREHFTYCQVSDMRSLAGIWVFLKDGDPCARVSSGSRGGKAHTTDSKTEAWMPWPYWSSMMLFRRWKARKTWLFQTTSP
jgi:hypothetical protein